MLKVIVIGSPGAGKSVFSQKLKNITDLPLYHLDMLYHKKDGTHISKEELKESPCSQVLCLWTGAFQSASSFKNNYEYSKNLRCKA